MKKILFVAGLFNILLLIGQSQTNKIQFKHYIVEDGLSQSWVQSIIQDSLGFMWFGTDDGLNCFDGYSFKVYKNNPKNSYSLRNNTIKTIAEDSRGRLWIGTLSGLCVFNRADDNFYYESDWPSQHITDLVRLEDKIYIGSISGLYVLDTKNDSIDFINIINDNVLSEININAIAVDTNMNVWIGTTQGLYVKSRNHDRILNFFEDFKSGKYYSNKNISSIEVDKKNRIWVGAMDGGLDLICYDRMIREAGILCFKHSNNDKNSLSNGTIKALKADKKGNLWIGIENSGLDILNSNSLDAEYTKFLHYTYDPQDDKSISSNSIYAFYEDLRGDIWIGTYGGGINFYNSSGVNFAHFKHITNNDNSLVNNNVNVFYEYNNYIWIGTEGGLSRYNKENDSFISYTSKPGKNNSLTTDAVWAITQYNSDLWIGTWSGGVNIIHSKNNNVTSLDPQLISGNNIFTLITDSEGILWIGTMGGGIDTYDKKRKKFTTYRNDLNDPRSIANDWVNYIYESSERELWISTAISVEIFDRKNDRFIHFFPDILDTTSISSKGAYVIFEDSKNNLWFGTEAGLNYFVRKDSSFIYYQEDNGLPNNSVKGILEDDHGNLWISTNRGLSKMLDGVNLPKNPLFENFDVSDGLQGNEFNRKAAFKDKDGKMYFGGTNGFNVFHPDSIKKNTYIPPVILTDFLVFNKQVDLKSSNPPVKIHISVANEIVLKHSQSVFSFEFSALNYINSQKNKYAYILEGFDNKWNEIGTQRIATYTNIRPGEYIFKVKASNNDGIWNEIGSQIKVIILPPWYRTYWAYFVYLILIILLITGFRRMIIIRAHLIHEIEVKQIEKEQLDEVHRLKSRFFTNVSHEFRSPLTLIISPLYNILNIYEFPAELKNQFQVILNNARRMLRLINQFMDISKIEAGYLKMEIHEGDLARYIVTIAELFKLQAKEKSIDYTIESNFESYFGWFDSDKIEKILYNLLSNAIKFTAAGGIVNFKVNINPPENPETSHPGYVEFWIRDSGIGIKKEEQEKIFDEFYQANNPASKKHTGTGIGLSLVQGLINQYEGQIRVESEYGKGTLFYIMLPFAKDKFTNTSIISKSEDEYFGKLQEEYPESNFQSVNDTISESESESEGLNTGDLPCILIIEDNPELRKYIRSYFKTRFRIYEASNGKMGYELALKINPDIIVSDIMMSEMDGLELLRSLKTEEKTSHIPVILLTAKASDESKVEGLETGADSFITKPFNISVLEAQIKSLLESRKILKNIYSHNIHIESKAVSITSIDAAFIQKAIDLVDKNISNPDFTVYTMSKELGMSRTLLHRKLVALTDLPPSKFIRALRLKRAAHLLVVGQRRVSEVTYEVGIKSRSYFTRSFKEMFGLSPTEYVENELKKNQNNNKDVR